MEDRVHHRRQGANGAGLARALGAERVQCGRHRITFDLDRTGRIRPRHGIVHEGSAQQLAAAGVVDYLFHQRLAHTLGDTAVDLALQAHGVDHRAHVVDHGIAD